MEKFRSSREGGNMINIYCIKIISNIKKIRSL